MKEFYQIKMEFIKMTVSFVVSNNKREKKKKTKQKLIVQSHTIVWLKAAKSLLVRCLHRYRYSWHPYGGVCFQFRQPTFKTVHERVLRRQKVITIYINANTTTFLILCQVFPFITLRFDGISCHSTWYTEVIFPLLLSERNH